MSLVEQKLQIATPEWALPIMEPHRYKALYGGRGSGKSHEFAEMCIEACVMNKDIHIVCVREVQKSIKMSVKKLLEDKIKNLGLEEFFIIQETVIKIRGGLGVIIFQGMQDHTADSIKSLEGFDILWVEEAQSLSQRSLDLLRPTIRKEGSELWFSWNPRRKTDPVDVLFRSEDNPPPTDSVVIRVNFSDNPWFPEVLRQEMEYDKRRDPDKYAHVWLGEYEKHSEARVFTNWRIEDFVTPDDVFFRFGADWGFSKDPTVLVRSFVVGKNLYIDYEAYQVGCEIDDTPDLFASVPESHKWPIIADSARPETISYIRRHGYPKIQRARKGKNSVYEGVEFLKNYDIVVHSRCVHVADELSCYSYKIDPETGLVTNVLEDDNNNVIDATRYSAEAARRMAKRPEQTTAKPKPSRNCW